MRKFVSFFVALGITVLALVAFAWFIWLPHLRPPLEDFESYGLDVSHHQGDIDWGAVANDEIAFAYIKATEGGDWVDPRFAENWAEAQEAGLLVGAYHFFRTCTDGALQAQNLLATVPDVASLPIAIDVEGHGRCGDGVNDADIRQELEELVRLVEAERGPVVFYVLEGFEALDDVFDKRERWQRSIGFRPSEDGWFLWQQSFRASVEGVDGPVDLNVMSDQLFFEF